MVPDDLLFGLWFLDFGGFLPSCSFLVFFELVHCVQNFLRNFEFVFVLEILSGGDNRHVVVDERVASSSTLLWDMDNNLHGGHLFLVERRAREEDKFGPVVHLVRVLGLGTRGRAPVVGEVVHAFRGIWRLNVVLDAYKGVLVVGDCAFLHFPVGLSRRAMVDVRQLVHWGWGQRPNRVNIDDSWDISYSFRGSRLCCRGWDCRNLRYRLHNFLKVKKNKFYNWRRRMVLY